MHHHCLRRARTALAAAIIAATALGAVASPASAKRVRVVDWNVDKNTSAVKRALVATISKKAVGATLQEVCASQYNGTIVTLAGKRGWSTHWAATRANRDNCPVPGESVGTAAIWTGGTTGTPSNNALEADPGRTPTLTCVHPPEANAIAAICSVHLAVRANGFTADQAKEVRKKQTWDISSHTTPWIAGNRTVIVGGDFNAQPEEDALNNMYAGPTGRGSFVAAHQLAGQPARSDGGTRWTVRGSNGNPNRKIDYIFFSQKHMKLGAKVNALQLKSNFKVSPHKLLIATAVING